MDQEQSLGRTVNKFQSSIESVYVRVHACRITHVIYDDNSGSNNVGDTAENVPNLS